MRGFVRMALLASLFFAVTARGAIIFQSGVVNASASSSRGSTNHPADAIMPPSGALTSNSASVMDVGDGGASASGSASFGATASFSGATSLLIHTGYSAGASAGGSMIFQETTTQTLGGSLSIGLGNRASGSLSVKDSADVILMSLSVGPSTSSSAQGQVMLTPGIYTMSWGVATQPVVGTGGAGNMSGSFGTVVPEPASMLSLALPSLLIRRRMRTCRAG